MNLEVFKLNQCIYCGICNPACPFFHVQRKEHLAPRAWTYFLNRPHHAWSSVLHLAENCLFCFRCFQACPLKVNYPAALLYEIFLQVQKKETLWLYREEEDSIYLQSQLPQILQPGFQPYPFSLNNTIKINQPADLQRVFSTKRRYINTYVFHLLNRITQYYKIKNPFPVLLEYWNLGQLLSQDELFSILPVIPEFLPSSRLHVQLPSLFELVRIPSIYQRLINAR